MKSISRTTKYDNLVKFMTRIKTGRPGSLTMIFFETFVNAKHPTAYHSIKIDELKLKKVIPTQKYPDYSSWRKDMILKGILICMASKEDYSDESPNFKSSMFRYGPVIAKYIEAALAEKSSLFERLDKKANQEDLDSLAEQQMKDRLELAVTKEKVADLELKVEDLSDSIETLLLHALPPDTPIRREIIRNHRYEKDLCIQLLKDN